MRVCVCVPFARKRGEHRSNTNSLVRAVLPGEQLTRVRARDRELTAERHARAGGDRGARERAPLASAAADRRAPTPARRDRVPSVEGSEADMEAELGLRASRPRASKIIELRERPARRPPRDA